MALDLICSPAATVASWLFVLLVFCAAASGRAVYRVAKRLEQLRASPSMSKALHLFVSGGGEVRQDLSVYRFVFEREYMAIEDGELHALGNKARWWLVAGLTVLAFLMLAGTLAQLIFDYRCLLPT